MQMCTANYRHLCSPVYPLIPDGIFPRVLHLQQDRSKGHTYLTLQFCLSNMYDLLLPPDIKGLKSIYVDRNFVALH